MLLSTAHVHVRDLSDTYRCLILFYKPFYTSTRFIQRTKKRKLFVTYCTTRYGKNPCAANRLDESPAALVAPSLFTANADSGRASAHFKRTPPAPARPLYPPLRPFKWRLADLSRNARERRNGLLFWLNPVSPQTSNTDLLPKVYNTLYIYTLWSVSRVIFKASTFVTTAVLV